MHVLNWLDCSLRVNCPGLLERWNSWTPATSGHSMQVVEGEALDPGGASFERFSNSSNNTP